MDANNTRGGGISVALGTEVRRNGGTEGGSAATESPNVARGTTLLASGVSYLD